MKKAERNRIAVIKRIENNPKVKSCYILKAGWYYRPGSKGYTENIIEAGIFTKDEAIKICKHCTYEVPVPVDVNAHNLAVAEAIINLSKCFIHG